MSYQEKRTTVSIITGAAILAIYCVYAFNQYSSGAVTLYNLKAWASTMLIFIGIGIAASIIIQIVFHILYSVAIAAKRKIENEQTDDKEIERSIEAAFVEDEMDHLIELKSMRIGFGFCGVGFIAGLVSLVLNYPPAVMLNILFLAICTGTLFEGGTQLYYYRRGL
jgi:uncharacterized BrkB/YihY/UPF0761 family membrane protein